MLIPSTNERYSEIKIYYKEVAEDCFSSKTDLIDITTYFDLSKLKDGDERGWIQPINSISTYRCRINFNINTEKPFPQIQSKQLSFSLPVQDECCNATIYLTDLSGSDNIPPVSTNFDEFKINTICPDTPIITEVTDYHNKVVA